MWNFSELIEIGGMFYSLVFIFSVFFGIFIGFFVSWFNLLYIAFHKIDENSNHYGGELVAQVLKSHGVKFVFTLSGGHISPILVASENIGIRIVDTRHEATCVFAADAVARLTGKIGVAVVTAGPGITNTVTAVTNAQLAESPVLIIGGASPGLLKGRGALQDVNQLSLFKSICKYYSSVATVRDIVPTLRHAICEAQSGTPGPVFVEIPIDVLYSYSMVKKEVVSSTRTSSLMDKLASWYVNNYLNNLFAGAWEPRDLSPLSPTIPMPSDSCIQKSIELISKSQKPVIVIGSQALLPPTSANALSRALRNLGIPCFLSGMARGLLGKDSNIQIHHQRRYALKNADLIILAGSVCDFRLSYGRALSRKAKIISVNRNSKQLWKNSDMFWKPSVAVQGDVGTFIVELSVHLSFFKYNKEWLKELKELDIEKENINRKMAEEIPENYLNPMKVLYQLEDHLPDNVILIADGGDFVGTAAYILRPRSPLSWLDPGPFGTLGVGGGFALGAKLCHPESEIWVIYGDGACGYSIAEIDTFTRHKVPVCAIIGNDACWSQIQREQIVNFGSNVSCMLEYTKYHDVAKGFGGDGLHVSQISDNLREVFKQASSFQKEGKSVALNVLIASSDFRKGSISV